LPPWWVNAVVRGEVTDQWKGGVYNKHVLLHCGFGQPAYELFAKAHIESAVHMDTTELESDKDWKMRPPHAIASALRRFGIDVDTTVIVYGTTVDTSATTPSRGSYCGQIAAFRVAVILHTAGLDVRVLDGGLDHWIAQGFSVVSSISSGGSGSTAEQGKQAESADVEDPLVAAVTRAMARPPAVDLDGSGTGNLIVDRQFVLDRVINSKSNITTTTTSTAAQPSPPLRLVSVRSLAEFKGTDTGYGQDSDIRALGDIPSALFGDCGNDAYCMRRYRNPDNRTMLAAPRLAERWLREYGIADGVVPVFYCGSGWRASEAVWYALVLGRPALLYEGGWLEWSREEGRSKS
jgi:molybdopterin synthase sulfurtransferase